MPPGVGVGEVRLTGVSRRFKVWHERNATLKETLLRRRRTVATDLWVLRDVDLHVGRGEALGIIGRNGIGKSTLLKLISGVIPPQSGTVEVGGMLAPLLELGAGFHPDFSGRENVVLQAALYGLDERECAERMDEIVAFAELEEFIDMPVKTYSSGMFMRLGFSIAAHVDADVMVLDEVLAVGDAAFQRKCLGRIAAFRERGGTILFVSHDQETVMRVCDRAILIEGGHVVADGAPHEVIAEYNRHLAGEVAAAPGAAIPDPDIWGGGRIRIDDVRVVGPAGPTDRLASGEPVTFEVDLAPGDGPVAPPVLTIDVHEAGGAHLFGASAQPDDLVRGPLGGPVTAALTLPRPPLQEGRFALSVTVRSGDESEIYHHLEFCREFSVFPQTPGVGPVRIEGAWNMYSDRESHSVRG